MKRYKVKKRKSKKMFKKSANRTHRFNAVDSRPMRGGYRL
jgi:hypothetical protein